MKKNVLCILLLWSGVLMISCAGGDDSENNIGFSGEVEWAKTFGGSNDDFATSVIQTQNGNLAVFGYSSSIDGDIMDKSQEENDYWLIMLDDKGNMIWNKTYGGSGDDVGQDIIQTTDTGFAIVGYSMSDDGDGSNNEGFHDNWILKLDPTGNILWEKSFGYAGHDHAYAVRQTVDGGFFITGFIDVTASGGEGNSRTGNTLHGVGEFWCHKLDSDGNIEWRKYFGGTNNDRSFDAIQANDGGFVITGFSESDDFDISNGKGSYDYWVIKLDGSGNLIWERSLGGAEVDQSRAITKTRDNGYIIAGNSFSTDGDNASNFGDNDFWVLKINEQGDILWQKSFGGSGLDLAFDAIETSDGGIIVVGETESSDHDIKENKGLKDVLVLKIE